MMVDVQRSYADQLRGVAIELRKLHAASPGLDWGKAVAEDLDRLATILGRFTREDVIALRSMSTDGLITGNPELDILIGKYVAKIQSVAYRIEELLPPEGG